MKKVYLIAFRGTGFRDPAFKHEPALIRAGHVGFAFEGDEDDIFGFHPTSLAVEEIGGEEAAIEWLKTGKSLQGALQKDNSIFIRANELVQLGARTQVWCMTVEVSDEEFMRIQKQSVEWYNEGKIFPYAFPTDKLDPQQDNCATFPRKLGLPILDSVGQIRDYVRILEQEGHIWQPKGN